MIQHRLVFTRVINLSQTKYEISTPRQIDSYTIDGFWHKPAAHAAHVTETVTQLQLGLQVRAAFLAHGY